MILMNVLVENKVTAAQIASETKDSFYYRWEFNLKSSPEQLWPYIADTNRFDKDAGLPAYDQPEKSSVDGLTNTRRRLRIKMYGVPLEWIEEPFQWVRPFHFGVIRNYKPGPLPFLQPIKQLRVFAELNETENGGTQLIYNVWATPRNWLGHLIIPLQIGQLSARKFAKTFAAYDKLAYKKIPFEAMEMMASLPTGARRRITALRQTLIQSSQKPELVDKLLETIITADDITLSQMRPYLLAKIWHEERQDVLALMLQATRIGLLNFKWDLLCPLCRVAKESSDTLADVTQTIHCDTCNIDYNANFDQSVELTFTPNPRYPPYRRANRILHQRPRSHPPYRCSAAVTGWRSANRNPQVRTRSLPLTLPANSGYAAFGSDPFRC